MYSSQMIEKGEHPSQQPRAQPSDSDSRWAVIDCTFFELLMFTCSSSLVVAHSDLEEQGVRHPLEDIALSFLSMLMTKTLICKLRLLGLAMFLCAVLMLCTASSHQLRRNDNLLEICLWVCFLFHFCSYLSGHPF